ncbi:hypothetical protein Sjap_020061 [Stephania japonica]|uniref:Uncharacterized protein n=1 Tax=Stephania japonica TaxID=461633 RepID=A0AAP0HYP4_9MAGN
MLKIEALRILEMVRVSCDYGSVCIAAIQTQLRSWYGEVLQAACRENVKLHRED